MRFYYPHIKPYKISSSVEYPYVFYKLLEMGDEEDIHSPSGNNYIVHASYYRVTSYLFNNRQHKLRATNYLPDNVIEDLKSNKATLFISNDVDTATLDQVLLMLTHFLAFGIPKKALIYADSNPYIGNALEKHGYQGFYYNWVEELFEVNEERIQQASEKIKSGYIRNKKFLFLGGKPRQHRVSFLEKCIHQISDFENHTFISIGINNKVGKRSLDVHDNWVSQAFIPSDDNVKPPLDFRPGTPWDVTYDNINYQYHDESYWNITPTTQYNYEPFRISINEKHFKPIVAMQPFIMLAEPKTLEFLKQSGYRTFSNWIDESYDDTLCDATRMNKIIEEVRKLNTLTHNELSDMLKDMLPTLIHNAELYMHTAKKKPAASSVLNNLNRLVADD